MTLRRCRHRRARLAPSDLARSHFGALALGATAIGVLAIGRLAVGAFTMTRGRVRSLTVDNLDVRCLHVGELTINRVVPEAQHSRRVQTMTHSATSRGDPQTFIKGVHGIRYQVKDVARAVAFYTEQLGFKLEHQQLPAFASVSLGDASSCSADRGPPARGRCRMDEVRSPAAGIAWC